MRFEGEALHGLPGRPSVHQLGFADLMVAMELLGEKPHDVVLLGVQPESTAWGADMTGEIAGAVPRVTELVLNQLQTWEG